MDNLPPITPTVPSSDEMRHRLVELFNNSKETLAQFYDYSRKAAALASAWAAWSNSRAQKASKPSV